MLRPHFLLTGLLVAVFGFKLVAAPSALIVVGLSGNENNREEFNQLATQTQNHLVSRGFGKDRVETLGLTNKATRETILAQFKKARSLSAKDEFWLILLGHTGRTAEGEPSFQVSGPRLAARDLKEALDQIPASQNIFIGTADSGGYLPILIKPNRFVLSATQAEGEVNQPRFPAFWVKVLGENPRMSFPEIATLAADLTKKEYTELGLALAEQPRMADPVTGKILAPPFAAASLAKTPSGSNPGTAPLISASDIKVDIKDPNAEWEYQDATPETKKLMAEASKTPNPEGHSAIILEQRLGFSVDTDRTTDQTTYRSVYLASDSAAETWANLFLPQSPPSITTKLELARVIQPDGSSMVFNPAKVPAASDNKSGMESPLAMVFLPHAKAGCLIQISYRTRQLLEATLPEFSEVFPIQQSVPALQTTLQVKVPKKQNFQTKLYNFDAQPEISETADTKQLTWKLGMLKALEPLPFDPPVRDYAVWLGLSSLRSWDDFSLWFRRLAKGSDAIGDPVRKKARELASGSKTREEKIQRSFEFVSALRYVAIEMGVQGFRPRNPDTVLANRYGDCKDKANLLAALLTCMDIDARLALVNRGSSTDVSFPSWQFNHAICYVPKNTAQGQKEDLWLDATDSTTPYGFVAPGNTGRQSLVFSKEKAEFLPVVPPENSLSRVRQEWNFQESADGSWKGKVRLTFTGLMDYRERQIFREASPRMRQFIIQQLLSSLLPDADYKQATVINVDNLSKPVEIQADLSFLSPGKPEPRLSRESVAYFTAPDRDRPLVINDGQKLEFAQTARYTHAKPANIQSRPAAKLAVAGETFSSETKRIDDKTAEIYRTISWDRPVVTPADYASLRQAFLEWNRSPLF